VARPNGQGELQLVAYLVSEQAFSEQVLKAYLSQYLPAYMLPAYFVPLKQLPLTANGKLDAWALPDPTERESGAPAYLPPRNPVEEHLVAVFEEVLRKKPIGVKEDFFALGGDSIKSIQVVSRFRKRGYSVSVQDVLLVPVIEELARRARPVTRLIDQETVEGVIPLTPIQEYFFQTQTVDIHHYNQSVLLHSKEPVSVAGIRAVFDQIVLHHDALRMVYRHTPGGWMQQNLGKDQGYALEVIEVPEEEDNRTFIEHCERIQSGFDLEKGPLFKVTLFRSPGRDRLFLVAHHLVVDGVSWRILFEDLSTLYHQYLAGEPLALPGKTDSFLYWQEKQVEYAQSDALQSEASYWDALEATPSQPLPLDAPEGNNIRKSACAQSALLSEEATDRLITQCYKAYNTEINDILITALSIALQETFGLDKITICLEGHGREAIGGDTDTSRTVGWFSTMYPVVIDMAAAGDTISRLIEVKENLHRIPNKGIGYGVLRYLGGKAYKLNPQINFNYLGDFGSGVATEQGNQLFEFGGYYHGKNISEKALRDFVLNVSGMVAGRRMLLTIEYSSNQFSTPTIERLLAAYHEQVENLIELLSAEEKVHQSPVDFTYKGLSLEQLQKLNA
jgi:non-ribosomal peptide synthase protein (TIGR01720 family)